MTGLFDALENYKKWFDVTDNTDSALVEERTKLIGRLHTILRPFILRRLKVYVTKKEYLLFVPMETVLSCRTISSDDKVESALAH